MLQILEISKTFSQALVLPSPTHSNFRSSLMDPTKSWTPKGCLVLLAVGVLQPRFKYQNKSDMCTKNWPKKRWMGFSVPINLFHLSELLQHTWRQLMGCQRVIQLSLGSLVGGTRCLWDHMLGRIPGQESWNQLLCGYAILSLFGWRERTWRMKRSLPKIGETGGHLRVSVSKSI